MQKSPRPSCSFECKNLRFLDPLPETFRGKKQYERITIEVNALSGFEVSDITEIFLEVFAIAYLADYETEILTRTLPSKMEFYTEQEFYPTPTEHSMVKWHKLFMTEKTKYELEHDDNSPRLKYKRYKRRK